MRFGKLDINPVRNPAILDTATWDREAAWAAVQAVDDAYWPALMKAAESGVPLPVSSGLTPHAPSCVWHEGMLYCLASLADGQEVFLALGPQGDDDALGPTIGGKSLPTVASSPRSPVPSLRLYPTEAAVIDCFFRLIAPDKGPRALGPVPRLGIGTRMTTAVWPAIWQAMAQGDFAANAIQNSVRELNFLETLLDGRPAEKNIAFGFGTIETGYTGSSFEGLWVAGVLDALKHGAPPRYGVDADHIQVKRGPDGLARAKRMLDATRYYSFYTLDVSDVLDYAALTERAYPTGFESLSSMRDVVTYHRQPRRFGDFDYRPDDATLGRLVGKYGIALDAVGKLYEYICGLKQGVPFDLELSIDEHPNDVPTFDCLTSETELIFVLLEAQRRGIPLTHVAPNFGVEKGADYRGADGLPGFEARCRSLSRIAQDLGVMTDFHSGDDLSAAARQAIGRATGGRNHFKVSPNLQLLFAEVLAEHHPELFRRWWEDALAYAQHEAAAGSMFAAECIRHSDLLQPSSHDASSHDASSHDASSHDEIFHNFSFAFVGRRDPNGQFICREEFYALSPAFYRAYQECITGYLLGLADDLVLSHPDLEQTIMDLFLDSSNPKEILEARSWGLLAGVTSNPGLISAAGPDMEKTLGAIVDASPGPVFAQVIGWHDPEPMVRQARWLHAFSDRIIVKLPASIAGLQALQQLKAELPDLRLAVTAIASISQAYLAAKAGADVAAIFNGPLDQGEDTAHDMIAPVRQIYANYGFKTKILACGRYPRLFGEIAVAGADICTMRMEFMRLLYEHSFTEARMNAFLKSWRGTFGEKAWPELP